jgi:hypothetical protein
LQALLKHHKILHTSMKFSPCRKEKLKRLSKLTLLITRNGNLILNSPLNSMTPQQEPNILEKTQILKLLFWMKISQVNLVSKQLKFKLRNFKIELISRLLEVKDPAERSAVWLELNNLLIVEDL